MREAIFDILGQRCDGDRVLDLYAGTGALGVEAAVRGATALVLVDDAPEALRAIRDNLARVPDGCAAEVVAGDAVDAARSLAARGERFDLVFADPPYDRGEVDRLLDALGGLPLLRDDGALVLEHSPRERGPDRAGTLRRYDERRYGQTGVSFFAPDAGAPGGAPGDIDREGGAR